MPTVRYITQIGTYFLVSTAGERKIFFPSEMDFEMIHVSVVIDLMSVDSVMILSDNGSLLASILRAGLVGYRHAAALRTDAGGLVSPGWIAGAASQRPVARLRAEEREIPPEVKWILPASPCL